jgi:hypothetical protein
MFVKKVTEMDTLVDLINVVNKKRLSKIDVLDKTFLNSKSENLYYKLYNGIESGKIKTDEAAAQLVYGTHKSDPRYKMLKSRLKDKALKSILLFDVDDLFNNERGRLYYDCLTHNQMIEILIQLSGTTKLVFELVKEGYKNALKHNFYDILKNYSFYMISYYSFKGDKKSLVEEEQKYLAYIDLAHKEQFAKYMYMKIAVDFNRPIPITNELLAAIKNDLNRFLEIRKEINNPEIDFYYFYLAFLFYENNNELYQILAICDEAEALMKSNPAIVTNTRRMVILLYKMKALLNNREFKSGLQLLNNEDTIVIPETSMNWYILKETEFKLYLQDKMIPEAYNVYDQVINNKSFKRQVAELTEKWKIYHAYLVFYDSFLNKGDYKFSLPKFLNDVPVNSKDKSGYNFAIRVIEILFNAARKDYNLIFSKMDALRVYRTRYLNDNTYKRNHLFLSILLKAEKSGFSNKEMANAIWPEIAELRKQNNYIIADWEIIPYETLWDIFVELAKK